MTRDELKEKIAILYGKRRYGHSYQDPECRIESINFADKILSLLAPELEKAAKWDRVKEIAERNWLDEYPCEGCSVQDMCDSTLSLCGQAESIVYALETDKEST